jgi:hypothetical protein
MNNKTLDQKLAQYHEFFSIAHDFTLNITALEYSDVTTFDNFLTSMPTPFKLASETASIDQSALRPLQALSGVSGQLVDFLNLQARKIDLLVGYILSQQDEEEFRYQGVKFGGGGLKFVANESFITGQMLEIKLFLLDNNCAIYCYGELIEITKATTDEQSNDSFHHKVIFHFIREEDRESLVRTSLHEQSKQLQKLAQDRNQDRDNK